MLTLLSGGFCGVCHKHRILKKCEGVSEIVLDFNYEIFNSVQNGW